MTNTELGQRPIRSTPARGVIAPSLLKAAEQGQNTAVRVYEDWTASASPAARYLNDRGAGPDSHVLGRWRQSPEGELICTWELKDAPTAIPARAISAGSADSGSVDRLRARDSREELWRWFVVAGLGAGYVLTGVAYFLG